MLNYYIGDYMSEQVIKKNIHWTSLIEVCGYENMVERIVEINQKDSVEALEKLKNAAKGSNASDVIFFAHKLKGAALTMGALDLAEKAHKIECWDEDQVCQTALERYEDLKNELDIVVSFLARPDWIELAKAQDAE